MSNITVYIIVEGQTEQTFVRELLAPEMGYQGIFLHPVLIGKPGHKGGDIRFERAKEDIGRFLKQRSSTHISTMFDYFRLEPSWPGNVNMQGYPTAIEKAKSFKVADIRKAMEDLTIDTPMGKKWIRAGDHQAYFDMPFYHIVPDPKVAIGWKVDWFTTRDGKKFIIPVEEALKR